MNKLNVAKNIITSKSGKYISYMLDSNITLNYIDLHYNTLRGQGAKHIFKSLCFNKNLKTLDISWNSIGSNRNIDIGAKLSEFFYKN